VNDEEVRQRLEQHRLDERKRLYAELFLKPGSIRHMEWVLSETIRENKAAGVEEREVEREVAILWLCRYRPFGILARIVWGVRIAWQLVRGAPSIVIKRGSLPRIERRFE
jgi:hypothetical protein